MALGLWIFTGVVVAVTVGWNVFVLVKDLREARRAKAEFEKTRLAAEMRERREQRNSQKSSQKN